MSVVDTNIIAGLFINGANTQRCTSLLKHDSAWTTLPLARVELGNVLATYHRANLAQIEDLRRYLDAAETFLARHLHIVLPKSALDYALRYEVRGYDAHFLVVADATSSKLITEDAKLRAAAPLLTHSIDEALHALA